MRRIVYILGILALWLASVSARAAEMVIQRGHTGQITRVAISANGEYLASAAGGDPIKLWQAKRGEFIRDLPDSQDELPLAWSPDGSTLLTATRDMEYARPQPTPGIRVRAMPSGKILRTLRGVSTPLWFNGKIVRATNGKVLRDWNISDGKLLSTRTLQMPKPRASTLLWDGAPPRVTKVEGSLIDNANERYFAFSNSGQYLVFGGEFGVNRVRVWNAVSGRLLHDFVRKDKAFGLAAISDDGQRLVTQGEDPNWSPPKGAATESAYSRTFTLHLWSLKTGREMRVWPGFYSLTDGAWLLKFSRDGKRVFGGGQSDANVYDVATGKVRKVQAAGFQDLARDEEHWANGYIGKLTVTSVQSGQALWQMPGTMRGGDTLAWSPDGKYLAAGSHLHIWDIERARLLESKDGGWYLLRSRWKDATTLETENLQSATIWKVDAAQLRFARVREITPGFPKSQNIFDSYGDEVFLSPDGKTLITNAQEFNKRGTLYVWDGSGQKLLKTIEVNKRENGGADNVSLIWLPDSRRFVTSTRHGIEIWNVALGKRETLLTVPADYPPPATPDYPSSNISLLAISPDGKYFATSNSQGKTHGVDVWDMTGTPRRLRTLPTKLNRNASFSPNGEWLAIGDFYKEWQGHTEVWKWREDARPRFVLPVLGLAGSSRQEAPAWSPDGKRIAIGAESAVKIFDAATGSLQASLAHGTKSRYEDKTDWLIWTPEGYFNAPDAGKERVRWMENGVLIPFGSPRDKALRAKFFKPAIVGKLLCGQDGFAR